MTRTCFLLFCMGITLSSFAQRVEDTEERRFAAMISRDTAALGPLLHSDLIYVHSNGLTESRNAHLQAIYSGKIVYESMKSARTRQKRWGKTALINGVLDAKGQINGAPFAVTLQYTALYRKRKGVWQLLNWQSTKKA